MNFHVCFVHKQKIIILYLITVVLYLSCFFLYFLTGTTKIVYVPEQVDYSIPYYVRYGEATNNSVPIDTGFVIDNKKFCSESKGLKYLIYVHSSPQNKVRRQAIRATWANKYLFKDKRTNLIFIMGLSSDVNLTKSINDESREYGDIVQGDFNDSYLNLTLKGIAGLKWINLYCPQAKFIIKADDDAYVNIFKTTDILKTHEYNNRTVICPLWGYKGNRRMPILRDPKKCMKWCVKETEFSGVQYFPAYCAGLSFILQRDLIPEMYKHSFKTPFFWIDDIYLTGLLLDKVSNVTYISVLERMLLKQNATEEYLDFKKPLSHYFLHVPKTENMKKIWEANLHRLEFHERRELNESSLIHKETYQDITGALV